MQAGLANGGSSELITGNDTSHPTRSMLLQLPGDVLSQIASHLSLEELIRFLSLHPSLLSLTQSHLSPLPATIHNILLNGPPYPQALAVLPSLRSFLSQDSGKLFLETLVRARPKWILERLELGRWDEPIWQEAFERRFLPSWKGYKKEDDSWRAIFLRMLGRLEHRNLGCTHEESWTRWITLHRNGSASINRFYSRLFDPYDIYDELKGQNNFSSQPTEVRVVLHLQDIRIIALGVLHPNPSIFTNQNAHLLLHPPLLRDIPRPYQQPTPAKPKYTSPPRAIQPVPPAGGGAPLVQVDTHDERSTFLANGSNAGPSSPSLRSTLANVFPGRIRRSSNVNFESDGLVRVGSRLAQTRSRDSDDGRRRSWGFGRPRQSSNANLAESAEPQPQPHAATSSSTSAGMAATVPTIPSPVPETSTPVGSPLVPEAIVYSHPERQVHPYPYTRLRNPLPAESHAQYPNFTPHNSETIDLRATHSEIEDDYAGTLWATEEGERGDEVKMAEWDEDAGARARWVGPMILIGQLHPATRSSPYPQSSNPGPTEGPTPDLGPKGMYVSLGFEDLKVIMPWVELKGGGAYHTEATRNGLGFE